MREAEYERLLDAVSDAFALVPEEEPVAILMPKFRQPPEAGQRQPDGMAADPIP